MTKYSSSDVSTMGSDHENDILSDENGVELHVQKCVTPIDAAGDNAQDNGDHCAADNDGPESLIEEKKSVVLVDEHTADYDRISNNSPRNECSERNLDAGRTVKKQRPCSAAVWRNYESVPVWVSTQSSSKTDVREYKSAINLKKRPNSALGIRCEQLANSSRSVCNREQFLSNFSRSLKLLGFQLEEFGITTKEEKKVQQSNSYNVGPTFTTRLLKRTVSLDSIKKTLLDLDVKELHQDFPRDVLCRAVYEEWYFRKLEDARRKREDEQKRLNSLKETIKKEEEEKRRKCEESFLRWKKLKLLHDKEKKQKGFNEKSKSAEELKSKVDAAYWSWRKGKDGLLKAKTEERKALEKREKEMMKSKEEQKSGAEKVFQSWKRSVDQKLLEQKKEMKIKKQNELAENKIAKEERAKIASICFKAWKEVKDNEIKKKLKENRLEQKKERAKISLKVNARSYEAEQAFEEWLDKAEERRKEKEILRKKKNDSPRPAWFPGGRPYWNAS